MARNRIPEDTFTKEERDKLEAQMEDDSDWEEDWSGGETEEEKILKKEPKAEDVEELDITKLKFTNIKDLKDGMTEVNIEAEIDFLGDVYGKGFGEEPYAIGFIKDKTGEIKLTFWGDDLQKAKPGVKIRVLEATVSTYRDQLQLNPRRARGITFI